MEAVSFTRGETPYKSLRIGINRGSRRKTGKTTRTVDEAIQQILKYNKIFIPTKHQLKREVLKLNGINPIRGYPNEITVIDPDWTDSQAVQEFLWRRIIKRLQYEHGHLIIKTNKSSRIISII